MGAGVWVCMKAAVSGIIVLVLAELAHSERSHRRCRPVIRKRLDDRKARTTVGAVDERIPITAIMRIEQLSKAVRARRRIRRHCPGRGTRCTCVNPEAGTRAAAAGDPHRSHVMYDCKRRGLVLQALQKSVDSPLFPFNLDLNRSAGITHKARKRTCCCQSEDKGAEADALHYASYP